MKQFTISQEHISTYPNPIILKKGEEVYYGKEDTEFPNWIFCKSISTRKSGWVPKQILSTPNNSGIAKVTKDYSAHELTVNQGQTVFGIENLNEWTYCKTQNGEFGWIPSYCLSST
ncbi:hypothetical protein Pryu01_01839 [Paraliobacillus ryukyuensis]|uniref:SH3 domain-containing protein n=1 Tax=Paraliobacillus ryukyuensis TaxID=200904 RepID=A0A366DTF7_9BACI|nr:SH3 domain-containing protein [Paraliobacillus ryukyuensis]RBO93195.1 SH3 domain-containing protein [Paraliobacillus ryukyuensis]